MNSTARFNLAVFAMVTLGCMVNGCTGGEDSNDVPEYGSVRIDNDWGQDVHLFLNGEWKKAIEPGKTKNTHAGEGLQAISLRDGAGNELFSQLVDIPDNAFAEYTVLENGQVIATAGNIRRPDIVGGNDEQIQLTNLASYSVNLYVNETLQGTAAAGGTHRIDVPSEWIVISFRRSNGKVLFEQSLQVPRNTVINYTVTPEGSVIATGEAIEENTDVLSIGW